MGYIMCFIGGAMMGALIGMVVLALCVVAGREEKEIEDYEQK